MERKYYKDGVEAPQQKETENGIIYNYNSEANHDMLIADGYEINEDDEIEPVPQSLTSRQLRLQWVLSGHDLATIQVAINQLPEPHKTQAQINWEYAGNFERNNELLCAVADALGISQEELDNIFRDGSSL